ncbi:MAG: hypothetical protein LBQ98_07515 [Nitrososphaerota archaeon]|jgi:predicted RNA binding protein with dsRBD fold (UPF0201 family)|nr:hypothetical protein [Nitrososphaerota archaeon]
MVEEVEIFVEADINLTETEEKVCLAISNVLGGATFRVSSAQRGSRLVAYAKGQNSLIKLRNLLRNDCIRDAARKFFFKKTRAETLTFYLNKQVAYAGHISFSEEIDESPLGPLHFIIKTSNPQQLIEWLTEKSS